MRRVEGGGVWGVGRGRESVHVHTRVCVYACARACVCVRNCLVLCVCACVRACVRARARAYVFVSVCVWVRAHQSLQMCAWCV